ncbi:MAG: hypothetical protein LLF96_06265 [Eubacteriales bacterium]|nr:hypothetical protein [Eubacteriales bacterium]
MTVAWFFARKARCQRSKTTSFPYINRRETTDAVEAVFSTEAKRLVRILLPLLSGILLYLLFGRLNGVWINDYDEARCGVNAYEMIRSGDFGVNTH